MKIIKNINQSFKAILFLAIAGGLAGCANDTEQVTPSVKEGMVPLEVKLAQGYSPIQSRATSQEDLAVKTPLSLPDGSTLRLILLKQPPTAVGITQNEVEGEYVYVVQSDVDGNPYLHPCEVHDGKNVKSDGRIGKDGEIVAGSIKKEPYYLANDGHTYYCMAISPAVHMTPDAQDGNKMKVAVNNQEELLTTNNHWTETQYSSFTVPTKVEEKATVELKPLMHATARIRVTIKNGTNVTELSSIDPILELDRVPIDPGQSWTGDMYDNQTYTMPAYNLVIGDTIQAQMGNNILYHRIYVQHGEQNIWYEDHSNTGGGDHVKKIELTAETTILPMDARPTPMIIRLLVGVNLTPMQFHYQVRDQFRPGYTYDYTATISLESDDLYVASWQDKQWSVTVTPDK